MPPEPGASLVKEGPGIGPVEAFDYHRVQERRLKISQVYAVASARLGRKRFPVGSDAARLAADVPQGSVAPDIAFRMLGMALDRDRA